VTKNSLNNNFSFLKAKFIIIFNRDIKYWLLNRLYVKELYTFYDLQNKYHIPFISFNRVN